MRALAQALDRNARMRFGPLVLCLTVLLVAAVSVTGCGSGAENETAATGSPTAKQALEELVTLLNHLKSENKPPPAKLEDLQPLEPVFLGACLGLSREEIVYEWGTTINPAGSDKVLAYEKAPESGTGWVLMQDGTIKTMDSGALKAAPKAAK